MGWTLVVLPPQTDTPLERIAAAMASASAMAEESPGEADGGPQITQDGVSAELEQITEAFAVAGLLQAHEEPGLPSFQLCIGIAEAPAEAGRLAKVARPGEVLVSPRARTEAERSPLGPYYSFERVRPAGVGWFVEQPAKAHEYLYDSRLSRLDGPFRRMFAAEIEGWIEPRRRSRGRRAIGSPIEPMVDNDLFGIALSGGGQRSGVFSLGVCQALARHGLLAEADYISTVSGGGYFGASLQAMCAEPVPYLDLDQRRAEAAAEGKTAEPPGAVSRLGVESWNFPYAFPRDPEPAPPPDLPIHGLESPALWHVRKHAKLLGSRIGLLDTETWATLYRYLGGMLLSWALFLVPLPLLGAAVGVWIWDEWLEDVVWVSGKVQWEFVVVPPIAGLGAEAVLYALFGRSIRRAASWAPTRIIVLLLALGPLVWLVYVGLGGAVYLIVDASRGGTEFKSLLAVLGSISAAATTFGVTGVTRAPAEGKSGLASRLLLLFGGYILLAVLITLLAWGMWELFQLDVYWKPTVPVIDRVPHVAIPFAIVTAAAALAVIVLGLIVVNRAAGALLNWLSIHQTYRERVTQTWVIAANPPRVEGKANGNVHRWTEVWPRPELAVKDLAEYPPPSAPYPLICTTINIPGSRGEKLPERKGDSFVIAPIYSGSASTRWVPTSSERFEYAKMALGQAATISGAAFSPNMGEKSSRTFSILMTIFNARIGRWCDNPRTDHRRRRSALKLFYKELFGNPSRDDHLIYLSDGGHFENLGLYELVRRRCKYIIAVTADTEKGGRPDRHGNLADATRMVREDFGVQVEMPNLKPITRDKDGGILSSYAVGKILYPKSRLADGTPHWEEGVLVVIKTGIIPDQITVDLLSHWRSNPDFPYTATLDQQFDQAQFEAYRELGYLAGRAVGHAAGSKNLALGLRFSQIIGRFESDFPLTGA